MVPKAVWINGYKVPIRFVEKPRADNGEYISGSFDRIAKSIEIDKELGERERRDVLMHEVRHAVEYLLNTRWLQGGTEWTDKEYRALFDEMAFGGMMRDKRNRLYWQYLLEDTENAG